jgi:integrase
MIRSMRLFQRSNGIWYVGFNRGKEKSLKTRIRSEAEAIFKRLKREWLQGRLFKLDTEKNVLLTTFTEDYLKSRIAYSPKTQKADELSLKLLADVVGHNLPLKLINVRRVDDFKQACLARGCKAATVNSYLRHIKSALSTAEEWGMIDKKLKVKLLRIDKDLPRFLRHEEINAILDLALQKRPEFHRMLTVYLWTGCRRNELLNLQWQDCHLDGDRPFCIVRGKGNKQRSVPLLPPAMEVLAPYRKNIGKVFQPINESTATHWFKELARECGTHDARLHDLRHTAATYMIAAGIPMRVVQEILGHASITTTGIYAHVIKDRIYDEMEKLRFD